MKITRPPPPLNFGASNDDGLAKPAAEGTRRSAAHEPQPSSPFAVAPGEAPLRADRTWAVAEPELRSSTQQARPLSDLPPAWPIYLTAFAVAVLWALGPIAFAIGYRSGVAPLQHERFAFIVFSLLAVGPAALMFGAAFFLRQAQRLAAEARRSRELEKAMLAPALRAGAEAGEVTRAVREQIAAAAAAAAEAREGLAALRHALSSETENLVEATHASLNAAQQLSGELGRERGELEALAQTLDSQAARAAEIIDQQAQKVSGVSRNVEAQLRDAEAALAARAEGLAAAAGEASALARTAGEDLSRHIARLETAGSGVADQVKAVEEGLSEQRSAIVALAQALREDHETFAVAADAQVAKLDDFIGEARRTAGEMSDRAADAGESLRTLVAEAGERFAAFAETAQQQRDSLGETAATSLESLSQAVVEQRARIEAESREAIDALSRAAEETREAAARHAAEAREQVDQLSEAAFLAGQKANQVFEARLEEARALVEQSAKMVGDAGAAAARRLEEGAASARVALDELGGMIATLEVRAKELPADARAQAEAARTAVAEGMEALMAHARRTAEEAHAIDSAFQDRVRRNFDMLSEAVRLMGTVASAPSPAFSSAPAPSPAPAPTVAPSVSAAPPPAPLLAPEPQASELAAQPLSLADPDIGNAGSAATGSGLAERLGLRPRLKLTPTANDEQFSAIFESGGARSPLDGEFDDDEVEAGDGWTWKDLLASLGDSDPVAEADEALLAEELSKMGIEPEKLLPESRIDQIAVAVQAGDLEGARQVVKRLAGAASRRIVRRLFTDEELRERANGFVQRYHASVQDAAVRDPEGSAMLAALGSDAGRVYLLLDQALGDAA